MALTNSQHDEIMRQYDKRQMNRIKEIARRKNEIFQVSPEYARLDGEVASVCIRAFESSEDSSVASSVIDTLAEIRAKKAEIMAALGYPADYLYPPFECEDCKDTGYIGQNRCHCFMQAVNELLFNQAGLMPSDICFDTFSLSYYSNDIKDGEQMSPRMLAQRAFDTAKSYVLNFGQKPAANLIFSGDTGTGKTFLSTCIAKELLDKGFSVVYLTAAHLFEISERNTFEHDESYRSEYERLFSCDLLVIDDLGTEFGNRFTCSQFFTCINERLISGLGTIISTNLNMKDLVDQYTERVTSRLTSSYTWCKLIGSDIRVTKKLNKII